MRQNLQRRPGKDHSARMVCAFLKEHTRQRHFVLHEIDRANYHRLCHQVHAAECPAAPRAQASRCPQAPCHKLSRTFSLTSYGKSYYRLSNGTFIRRAIWVFVVTRVFTARESAST